MLDFTELSGRLSRVCAMMDKRDVDVVVAIDVSRDEILSGTQRWLTGFVPFGAPAAALVFRDGHVELVSPMLGKTVPAFYAGSGLPVDTIAGYSAALIAERVGRAAPRRIGHAEAGTLPYPLADALRQLPSRPELVDLSDDFTALRLQKSAAEQAAVRRSCAIADKVWNLVPDFFKVGRRFHEVIADVDHIVKLEGGEGGFHLLARLPVFGLSMRALADPETIVAGARYMLEISPRHQGYYSQLTSPVLTGPDTAVAEAFADLVAAKAYAQPRMVPGADLSEIAGQVDQFLASRGRAMASKSLGHFCGIALEEPRHDPGKPFLLREGMTLIFHPVLASAELMSLMRADTYLIAADGAQRLNAHPMEVLQLA